MVLNKLGIFMKNIINQLNPIFREIFDDDNLVVESTTTALDIEEWDSLAHIRLTLAIEKFFGVRFSADEISNLENVGNIAELIQKKRVNV